MKIVGDGLRLSASDVANFVACQHLTRLDLLNARHQLPRDRAFDLGFEDLVKRGEVHEGEVLSRFRADGCSITQVSVAPGAEAEAAQATREAISGGADVIYQGALVAESPGGQGGQAALLGRPDFLVRADLLDAPDGKPRPDGVHYEVVDAKLARTAKARAVAQTAFYSHLLTSLQGVGPRWMHLALGDGRFTSLKVGDYAAYERQARRALGGFVADDPGHNPPTDPYPEPVEHCVICRWSDRCTARRRSDDDLSLVAGITRDQRRVLKSAGVMTRRGLAALPELPNGNRASEESLAGARQQARLQVASEDQGRITYELLGPERDAAGEIVPNRGLLALPEPSPGDLFFDIEGARYYSENNQEFGLEYLFGVVDTADLDERGRPRYTQIWDFDRSGEKGAFEELIDFITERRRRHPGLHVYHYNHYEPTSVDHLTELHGTRQEAVGWLMGRFATREDEVDNLFRLGVFVDLYRVVRQGVRAGVESYSIKRLEPLCGYTRQMDLRQATENLIAFEAALEDGTARDDETTKAVVAAYNEDDCRATLALRDWLEERRADLAAQVGLELPRPVVVEGAEATEDPDLARIKAALLDGLPADPTARTPEQRAKALLADLLEWHRRDAKPVWWRYFYLRPLSPPELVEEPDALGGLTGGDVIYEVKRSVVRRFFFPPQEYKLKAGDGACDPVSERGWTVVGVNDELGTIDLKVEAKYAGPWPEGLVEKDLPRTGVLADQVRALGERVVRDGVTGRDAATALLLGQRPSGQGIGPGPLRIPGETLETAAVRLAMALRGSCLPIQGPPGTGKTFTAARQILELVRAGRTVGITGPSHAAITNLIAKVADRAGELGYPRPRIGQKADGARQFLSPAATHLENAALAQGLQDGELDIAAGTAWVWARPEFQGSVDTLFVDEAGQLSLANVLAVAGAATNLVLVGDPQQLAQPSQAAHPPGAGVSALEHILGDHATVAPEAGLLLDQTWRMHPSLCRYTSATFYDGKLTWADGLELQEILGDLSPRGAGLRVVEVPHEGNTNASPEEALMVAQLANELVGRQWQDKGGVGRPLGVNDVLVVTPYNAQIRAIEDALARVGLTGVRVGTVDKFQGGEAPVAIYSMATSSADVAPRGLEFLYDPHRLNVATSRARALALIVASPALIRVACRTPRQMYLANALCRAWEIPEK
ncbi:MAG TPA: TM0106 family RecB-like putative nuclease [Streptosporangiaceae bacterium]